MAQSDADRKRRQRLREIGYAKHPCPVEWEAGDDGTFVQAKKDTGAWAEGLWRRQAEEARSERVRMIGEARVREREARVARA